jgi:hypothetical protein
MKPLGVLLIGLFSLRSLVLALCLQKDFGGEITTYIIHSPKINLLDVV